MENYSLLCKYENLRIFVQLQPIFQMVDALLCQQKSDHPISVSDPFLTSALADDEESSQAMGAQDNPLSIKTNAESLYGSLQLPSNYLFRSALEVTSIGVVSVDSLGQIAYFNSRFAQMWEIPLDILRSREYSQCVAHYQTKTKDIKEAQKFAHYVKNIDKQVELAGVETIALQGGRSFQQVFQPLHLDPNNVGRTWVYIEAEADPLKREPDVFFDLLTPQFLTWANATDTLIFIFCEGCPVYANSKAQETLGCSQHSLSQSVQFQQQFQRWTAQLCQQSAVPVKTYKFTTYTGQEVWLQSSATLFSLGNKEWMLISAADVTALKQKEIGILRLLSIEKAISEKRRQLASTVTHRLINSLNYILGMTDAVDMYYPRWDTKKRKECIERLQQNAHQVHQLTNKLKEICQLATDETTDCTSQVDAYKICWHLVEQFKPMYPHHNFVALTLTTSTWVALDASLLKTVLFALLENAARYSFNSSLIKLLIIREASSITFQVYDTGVGVLATERDQLFKPLYRGSNVGDSPGMGLGLTMVKALLDVQGARLTISDNHNSNHNSNHNQGVVASVTYSLNDYPHHFDKHYLKLIRHTLDPPENSVSKRTHA